MLFHQVQQLGVHEGFAAQKAEKTVAVGLGLIDEAMKPLQFNAFSWRFHIHPAPLTTQIAAVEDTQVEKGWEIDTLLGPSLESLHRKHAFEPEKRGEFPQGLGIGRAQYTHGESG